MEPLLNHLRQFGHLSSEDTSLITQHVQTVQLSANAYFLEAGHVCRNIAFIAEGVMRVFFYDRTGHELSRYFIAENQYAVDLQSFNTQTVSSEYIQAVTNCTLLLISRPALTLFEQHIHDWAVISRKITEDALLKKVFAQPYLLGQDATTRYVTFVEQNPALANRIPMMHLASFLGITPQSLSRIRRQVVEKRY
jgi:CRP-like cAMP-binding protein